MSERGEGIDPRKLLDADAETFAHDGPPKAPPSPAGAEPIGWLGPDPASQILTLLIRQSQTPHPVTNVPPKLPFDPACIGYRRTHGLYVGDGAAERRLKLGFRPAGVAFDEPSLFEIESFKIPLPQLVDDGFVVGLAFNERGRSYEYVAFFSPEDAHLAPKNPPPAHGFMAGE